MYRPLRRRSRWGAPLNQALMGELAKANRLVANGQPGEAAPLYARLAQEMERSSHPRRAANLYALAAHAYADSADESNALAHARLALNLFIQYQVVERTPRFFANITRKIRNRGMAPAAEALQKEFGDRVGPLPAGGPPARQPQRGHLPPACPQCGAPLRSDEVEWIDARSVECVYCGLVVRTEA